MKKPLLTVAASTTLVVHAIAQDAVVKDFQVAAFKEFKPLEKKAHLYSMLTRGIKGLGLQ